MDCSSIMMALIASDCGLMLCSMPISHNYTVYAHHFGQVMEDPQSIHNERDDGAPSIVDPLLTTRNFGQGDDASNDYYLNPTEAWAFALDADPADPAKSLTFAAGAEYSDGAAPFNRTGGSEAAAPHGKAGFLAAETAPFFARPGRQHRLSRV